MPVHKRARIRLSGQVGLVYAEGMRYIFPGMHRLILIAGWAVVASIGMSCAGVRPGHVDRTVGLRKYESQAFEVFVDGVIHDINDEWNDAIAHYQKALEMEPSSAAIHTALAENYFKIGRLEKARYHVDQLLAVEPQNIEGLELLADIHFNRHEFVQTISTLERVVRLDPGHAGAHYKLISLYELQGKAADAITHYETLLRLNGPNPMISLKLGDYYLRNNDRERAIAALKNGRDADPNNIYLIEALGQAYAIDRQYAKAMDTYDDLYKLDDNAAILVRVGNLALQAADYARAADVFEKAERALPPNGDIQRSLGFAFSQTGRQDLAILRLEKAIALNPMDVISMSILAPIYQDKGNFHKSDSLYEAILIVEPENDLILNNYSYSLAVRNVKLEHAMAMARKAVHKAPDNSHYLDTMGWILFRMGNYAEALKFVHQSYELNSGSWEVADHLGDIHSKLNNTEKAVGYWIKALELNPNQSTIRAKIESTR